MTTPVWPLLLVSSHPSLSSNSHELSDYHVSHVNQPLASFHQRRSSSLTTQSWLVCSFQGEALPRPTAQGFGGPSIKLPTGSYHADMPDDLVAVLQGFDGGLVVSLNVYCFEKQVLE